jgi:hypothetical protein
VHDAPFVVEIPSYFADSAHLLLAEEKGFGGTIIRAQVS